VRVRKYTASEPSSSTGAEQEQCVDGLDWNQYLAPNYFEEIPYDPKTGSASVTKYEAKMSANGRISIRAVGAEEDETLEVSR